MAASYESRIWFKQLNFASSADANQSAFADSWRSCSLSRSKSTGLLVNSEAPSSPALVVAIGSHQHDREIREPLLYLAQQLQAVHPRHVDVRENRDQRGLYLAREK